MSEKLPAFPIYIGDWKKDTAVQALDYWTRGVWTEMLYTMWDSEERGRLVLNGKAYPIDALAQLLSLTIEETTKAIKKLLDYGVARKDKDGVIFNKRMVKDEKKRIVKAENGAKGGRGNKANQKLNESKTKANSKLIVEDETATAIEGESEVKGLSDKEIKTAFEGDWSTLPRLAGDKQKALICYRNSVGKNLAELRPKFQARVAEFNRAMEGREKKYIPYGETFVRNWETLEFDEIPTKPNNGKIPPPPEPSKTELKTKIESQIAHLKTSVLEGVKMNYPLFHMGIGAIVEQYEVRFREDPLSSDEREWFQKLKAEAQEPEVGLNLS